MLVKNAAFIVVGNIMFAFSVGAFLIPHGIIMGGATGIALTISQFFSVNTALVILVLNGLLFILGTAFFGREFAVSTVASAIMYPLFLAVVQQIPGIDRVTDNDLLATLCGGALLGVGLGMVLRVGASTGGTDVIALVLNKLFHFPTAVMLYIVDGVILLAQAFSATTEQILYGIVTLVLTTMAMNRVIVIGKSQIQLFVITDAYEEVRVSALKKGGVGVTMVKIEAGYRGIEQKGVLCVLPNRKLHALKEMILDIDPGAFITITQIKEVDGRGFSRARVEYGDD